jgi:alcohol dehydrogenase, propanol-preferring
MARMTGLRVVGSSVGTESEMAELLEMALARDMVPIVKIYEFDMVGEVIQKLTRSQIGGKVVLRIPQ